MTLIILHSSNRKRCPALQSQFRELQEIPKFKAALSGSEVKAFCQIYLFFASQQITRIERLNLTGISTGDIEVRYGTESLDWDAVNSLFIRAPLGSRQPELFKKACEKSGIVVSAYYQENIVGFGRALTDFMAYAAIYDVAVLPEFQGKGIGSLIIHSILKEIPECWVVTLFAEPGKEKFYERFGFNQMKTAMGKFKNASGAQSKGFI